MKTSGLQTSQISLKKLFTSIKVRNEYRDICIGIMLKCFYTRVNCCIGITLSFYFHLEYLIVLKVLFHMNSIFILNWKSNYASNESRALSFR